MTHFDTPPELWFATPQGIVSATPGGRQFRDLKDEQDELAYYGGYLVCESVMSSRAGNLIAAAPQLSALALDIRKFLDEVEKTGEVSTRMVREMFYQRLWRLGNLSEGKK